MVGKGGPFSQFTFSTMGNEWSSIWLRKERGRDEESVRNQFESMVIPMFKKFVEPSKRYADLLVTTGGENDVAVKMVAAGLASKISEV